MISRFEPTKFNVASTPRYFGNFAATVRSLELQTAVGARASLLSFICAFPLVDNLAVELFNDREDHREVMHPLPGPSFKEKLRLPDMSYGSVALVELLCALPLSFHTISVPSSGTGRLPQFVKFVIECGKTRRSLHIMIITHSMSSTHLSMICQWLKSAIQWVRCCQAALVQRYAWPSKRFGSQPSTQDTWSPSWLRSSLLSQRPETSQELFSMRVGPFGRKTAKRRGTAWMQ